MLINRHNYEEFFILYMDNELDPAARRMVEDIVQLHPDLKEELDILLQYKLVPDGHIVFDGKEELMKENGQPQISITNQEEWFSLYIDDELLPDQRRQVEAYVEANTAARHTMDLLQKTKLQPELVVFPDKSTLYRKEEKTRRILPFYWRAAAAILVIILGITAFLIVNKKPNTDQPEVAKTPTNVPGKNIVPENNESSNPVNNQQVVIAENPFSTDKTKATVISEDQANINTSTSREPKNKTTVNPSPKNSLPDIKDEEAVANLTPVIQPTNNLPRPVNNPNLINTPGPKDALAMNVKENNIPATNAVVTSANPQPSDIIQATYTNNNEPLAETEGKKNKSRGLFRKIARTFEKRTNIDPTDDNRLLVAGLSFKLK